MKRKENEKNHQQPKINAAKHIAHFVPPLHQMEKKMGANAKSVAWITQFSISISKNKMLPWRICLP